VIPTKQIKQYRNKNLPSSFTMIFSFSDTVYGIADYEIVYFIVALTFATTSFEYKLQIPFFAVGFMPSSVIAFLTFASEMDNAFAILPAVSKSVCSVFI